MKTMRLFGIALFTVLMSVSFSACGGSDDDVDNGSSPASFEGEWRLNTFNYYHYYIEDGRKTDEHIVYVDGKMLPTATRIWGNFQDNEIWILTKEGENIIISSPTQGTGPLKKLNANEYLSIENSPKKQFHRVVIKRPSYDKLIIEIYDNYFEDERGTIKKQEDGYCSLGIFTFFKND